ncbi:hypothetical protein [Chryseobacterium aquifrigidense]|uniref:Cleaved adhesin domain-containing protein n=1 Tax=Chryseobacterium aquifrigidense TaxID=558021 RepID=A0A543ECC6_9FLAO|nr:hypothetical protein [Chryseobacterium aquifrigidense]TQM19215.1 hypothetical protein FB551_3610 [Chryseobacterium aquifrigidense]
MKKILFVTSLVLAAATNAQVGINTPNPTNMLDVNGDLNIRKELRTGGTDVLKGSAGTAGDIFHNNTDLGANDWKVIKIADGQGSMSVFSINTVSDKTGVSFSGNSGATNPYNDGEALTGGWTVIPGTVDTFSVTNGTNKATFSFQTTVQKTGTNSASFACGVFVDNALRAVRTDVLLGDSGGYKIFNLNATLTNLTPKNQYSVKVACIKRAIAGTTLGIGRAVDTAFLNSDMSQSVLTTSILQPY